jgi:hypothetical protein
MIMHTSVSNHHTATQTSTGKTSFHAGQTTHSGANLLALGAAFCVVAAITAASGLIVAVRMY